jgi:hypothetical protein
MTTATIQAECPCCGTPSGIARHMSGSAPAPRQGAVVVCSTCGAACEYDHAMAMVLIPEARLQGTEIYEPARALRRKVRELQGLPV